MSDTSMGQHRLDVITRQLTAASLGSHDGLVDAQAITRTDLPALTSWLCHDNPEVLHVHVGHTSVAVLCWTSQQCMLVYCMPAGCRACDLCQ